MVSPFELKDKKRRRAASHMWRDNMDSLSVLLEPPLLVLKGDQEGNRPFWGRKTKFWGRKKEWHTLSERRKRLFPIFGSRDIGRAAASNARLSRTAVAVASNASPGALALQRLRHRRRAPRAEARHLLDARLDARLDSTGMTRCTRLKLNSKGVLLGLRPWEITPVWPIWR